MSEMTKQGQRKSGKPALASDSTQHRRAIFASGDSNVTSIAQASTLSLAQLAEMPTVHLLDYAAGNIRSLVNAIEKLGWQVEWIKSPRDVAKAEVSSFTSPLDL